MCTSTIGCYIRRWYSLEFETILQRWDCIEDEHDVSDQIDYKDLFCGGWDTSDNAYKCCDNEDLCNKDLNITLEIEKPSPSVYTSILPYFTATQHNKHKNLHVGE